MTITTPHRLPLVLIFGGAVASFAAAAETPAAPDKDSTVVLSPFVVSNEDDSGYAASSTLSGTRLKTSLRDTAAAVSVITPELLQDLGLDNVNQLASFMVNVDLDPNGNAAFNTEQNASHTIRIRGQAARGSQANFFGIPWAVDAYNTERITQTRGPNSLIFGVGNSAGSVSSSTKQASLARKAPAGKVTVKGDQNASLRTELDVQSPVIADRLGLRLALLDERKKGFMEFDDRNERRLYATTSFKIAESPNYRAILRGSGEWGHAKRLQPDLNAPDDFVTSWFRNGQPIVTGPVTGSTALPPGTTRGATAATLVVIDGSPTAVPVMNWNGSARGGPFKQGVGYSFGPGAVVPLDINYSGQGRASNFTGRSLQFFFEQTFFRTLSVEVASSRTDLDLDWVRTGGATLNVDVNRNLPNGQPNPNAGRIYLEANYRLQEEQRTSSEDRITAAYIFEGKRVSPWLGTWVFSGLLNRTAETQGLDDSREVNLTPLPGFNAQISHAQNRIVRRTYLFNGANGWQPDADYGMNLSPVVAPGVTPGLRNTRAVNDLTRISGWTLGTQGKMLRDRLVLTYGHRHDEAKNYTAAPLANAQGFFEHWTTYASPLNFRLSADTQTFGAVGHVADWASLFYNKSESIDLGSPRRDIFAEALPTPAGKGEDYGFKFSFFGNRLNATLSRYESASVNQSTNPAGGIPTNLALIEDATGRSILLTNRGEAPPDTQSLSASGYELELVFNPTPQWRIMLNGSRNETVLTEVNLRFKRFLEERVFPLQAQVGSVVAANGESVDVIINRMRNQLLSFHNSLEGSPAAQLREWSGNLVTNYSFKQGRLKGVGFGGYAQYRTPNVIGLMVDAAGNPIPDQRIKGDALTSFGAHLRYERKLRDRFPWSVQLNVYNLFDHNLFVRKVADPTTGDTTQWGMQAPRTFSLTTSLGF